ncbi:MAG: SIMPL domain-containing protein [Candidatus Poribacteria bacterium]|nr:SIMPL domain-containing protein [Candidatus Poribacteria bacterium]
MTTRNVRVSLVSTVTLALFAAVVAGCAFYESPTDVEDGVRVVGTGRVMVEPDIAYLQIGVQTFNADAQVAVDENNAKAASVIAAIKSFGVEDKDVQTTAFNIYPQRDYQNNTAIIVGYQVNNSVRVTARNLDVIGGILQASIGAGANDIGSVVFTREDFTAFRDEARTKAVEDARAKAEGMVSAAGEKLGSVVRITEAGGFESPTNRGSYDSAAGGEVPIETGELTVTVTVEVLFEIK